MQTINNSGNKRRFRDDQVRSLESLFSSETRPESREKQQIADQLGLHPRQVAVWFQNRRARCKSKHVEHEYTILKARYDSLASKLHSLKTENQSLVIEVQRLRDLQARPKERSSESGPATCSCNGESLSLSSPEMDTTLPQKYIHDKLLSAEAKTESFKFMDQERDNLDTINMVESAGGSLTSSENCSDLVETTSLIEQNCYSDWWELWA